ncbi:Het-C-domain-containing protein [Aspergillus campestris IBT 28561]|uniref:Het-C-domain-containing protein n=1 Tax=Aspergillus campestris (strain IBT 28561) TaxID=1392248 RepID=A0A2I1D6J5_ASPC2|nr:Het-C-domain-containing protein [Aspergillus campestris IBT 28561]PKY05496.1 Het-C-domain-containing protein [Aspergillus campestris IBT 28561]
MASSHLGINALLILSVLLVLLPSQVDAFGAGNIASISAVEGKNWRHGDIEDMLKTVAFITGHKWTSTMIKRVYFGNWLRDYSQAMDVGTLKSLPADTIRVLVWILSFMTFGLATAEFEVTGERLGVYRPEEHIDNPKDYADNEDARVFDKRLRGPIRQAELDIDPHTGMKNYIANERGDWATSTAYIKYSLARSIHYGRTYTHGSGGKGNEEDLCEALRCLGQGLHTLEDFAAHTNYCELALREMGFHNVFAHTGARTQINLHGHKVFPLVTGTFGMVDFFHSVLGEANDHFTQSEVNEMDIALGDAQSNSSGSSLDSLTGLLGKIPGTKDLVTEAENLKRRSEEQESSNKRGKPNAGYSAARGLAKNFAGDQDKSSRASDRPEPSAGKPSPVTDIDPAKTIEQIYPILQFRDNVVRKLNSVIEKIPGLESLVEKISETVTVFVMSLLAPFIRPIINTASKSLQSGSSGVIDASGKHQFEPWTDPHCTDPTHSLLSKDHFSNILNDPAGNVASAILKYVAPRVLYAWQHPDVPEKEVLEDCLKVFHHPATRDMRNEAHRTMFEAVESWAHSRPDRGRSLNDILSSEGVKAGKNNGGEVGHSHGAHSHGAAAAGGHSHGGQSRPPQHQQQQQQQQRPSSSHSSNPLEQLSNIPGLSGLKKLDGVFSGLSLGGSKKEDKPEKHHSKPEQHHSKPPKHHSPPQHHSQPQHHTPPRRHSPPPHQSHHENTRPHHSQHHESSHQYSQPSHHSSGGYGGDGHSSGYYGQTSSQGHGQSSAPGYGQSSAPGYGQSSAPGYGQSSSNPGYGQSSSNPGYGHQPSHGYGSSSQHQSQGYQDSSYGGHSQGHGGSHGGSHGQGYSSNQGYGGQGHGQGQSYGSQGQSYGGNQGYGNQGQSYGGSQSHGYDNNQGYGQSGYRY